MSLLHILHQSTKVKLLKLDFYQIKLFHLYQIFPVDLQVDCLLTFCDVRHFMNIVDNKQAIPKLLEL